MPCTQTHSPCSPPVERNSFPSSGALRSPAQRWRSPHTGGFSQTPLLLNPLVWPAAEGTTSATVREKLLVGRGLVAVLPCFIAAPAQALLRRFCPQALRKRQQEPSRSLWPHSTRFSLPRQTGGLVHCPSVQVIDGDPSRT